VLRMSGPRDPVPPSRPPASPLLAPSSTASSGGRVSVGVGLRSTIATPATSGCAFLGSSHSRQSIAGCPFVPKTRPAGPLPAPLACELSWRTTRSPPGSALYPRLDTRVGAGRALSRRTNRDRVRDFGRSSGGRTRGYPDPADSILAVARARLSGRPGRSVALRLLARARLAWPGRR